MYVQTCTIVYFKLSSTIMTVSSGLIKVGLQGGTMEQIMCSVYLHKLHFGVCTPSFAVLLAQVVECPTAMFQPQVTE